MEITEYMVDRAAAAIRSEMLNNGWMITGITPQRLRDVVRRAARKALEAALKTAQGKQE